jgi:two-component system, NtrC family, sensor histidine kinase HydH
MEAAFLQQMMAYVGFDSRHAQALAAARVLLEPAFPAIVDRFYDAVLAAPEARAVFMDGPGQIERQKGMLTVWLQGVLSGSYDDAYLALRARIGRTHVRIKLDQRFAIGGMNLVRHGLHAALAALARPELAFTHEAIDKICDVELAIMAQTYAEDSEARLRDHEKLATLGQLAGFIGHELRNPLAVMETSLHLLRKRLPADDATLARHADRLTAQVRISSQILSSLLELASDRALERAPWAVEPLVREAVAGVPLSEGVTLELQVAPELPPAELDHQAVRQLLVNLVSNAGDALAERAGERRIVVRAQREGHVLVLTVDDNGAGIAESVRSRLFQPLTTSRSKGKGLGLALCRRIAEKHGGDIRALQGPLGGARLEARLHRCFAGAP